MPRAFGVTVGHSHAVHCTVERRPIFPPVHLLDTSDAGVLAGQDHPCISRLLDTPFHPPFELTLRETQRIGMHTVPMMAAPPRRATFVIYVDEPASLSSAAKGKSRALGTRTNLRVTIATAGDKENLHPLTGRRPNTDAVPGKKRKTTALATKLLVVPSKATAESKKRKLAGAVGEEKEKKEKTKRTRKASRVVKAPELPKVDEEAEEKVAEEQKEEKTLAEIVQASVDARCYDLTVLPLADVTEAYEHTGFPTKEAPTAPVVCVSANATCASPQRYTEAVIIKAAEPETPEAAADTAKFNEKPTSPLGSLKAMTSFSTPERKRIYSAFTFESPSPASRRFASWGDSSVDRLPEIKFSP